MKEMNKNKRKWSKQFFQECGTAGLLLYEMKGLTIIVTIYLKYEWYILGLTELHNNQAKELYQGEKMGVYNKKEWVMIYMNTVDW